MFTKTILFLACIFVPLTVYGEEITLARAVELAIGHAPAMKEAEADRDVSAQDMRIGLAGLLPRINATGSYQHRRHKTRYDGTQNVFQPDLRSHDSTVGLRATQPLFDLERWAGYRQGTLSAETGEMKLRLERQRLLLETAQAYLDVVTAQAGLRAARAKETAAERLSLQAQAKFEAGGVAANERLDADARHDLARAEQFVADNSLNQANARLASLTGVAAEGILPPTISEELSLPSSAQAKAWELRAAENAISVRLAHLQFRAAQAEELKVLGSGMPKVEAFAALEGGRATTGQLGIGERTRDQTVGVQASVPLFAGGGDWARVQKSRRASLKAEFALQDDVRLARLTARQALFGYEASISQLQAMRKAVVSAKEASEAARMGHEVGLRTVTEVLDADELRFDAQKKLTEAEAQFVFAALQLQASAGELDVRPILEVFGADNFRDAAFNPLRQADR